MVKKKNVQTSTYQKEYTNDKTYFKSKYSSIDFKNYTKFTIAKNATAQRSILLNLAIWQGGDGWKSVAKLKKTDSKLPHPLQFISGFENITNVLDVLVKKFDGKLVEKQYNKSPDSRGRALTGNGICEYRITHNKDAVMLVNRLIIQEVMVYTYRRDKVFVYPKPNNDDDEFESSRPYTHLFEEFQQSQFVNLMITLFAGNPEEFKRAERNDLIKRYNELKPDFYAVRDSLFDKYGKKINEKDIEGVSFKFHTLCEIKNKRIIYSEISDTKTEVI